MKRIIPLLVGLVILGAFGWTLFFLYQKSQAKPVVYETEATLTTDIIKKTVATGSIIPRREVEIKPRISGVIDEVYVKPGQEIKKDAPVARIKIIPDLVTLNAAEGRVRAAKIAFEAAVKELGRTKSLADKGLAGASELDRLLLDHELKKQELDAAEGNLDLIRDGVSNKFGVSQTIVRATASGMVLSVPVEPGSPVIEANTFNAGTTVASVANMNDMIFEGKVDEAEVGKIQEGMDLSITIAAIQGRTFPAKLEHIAPKGVYITGGTIEFQIRAALEPVEGVFVRAGYSATADIVLDRRTKVLAVREGLITFDKGDTFVEVEVSPQVFEKRKIEVGLSDGINIEVKSGLDSGAKLKSGAAASTGT
jgi:HlyD family secretion protein